MVIFSSRFLGILSALAASAAAWSLPPAVALGRGSDIQLMLSLGTVVLWFCAVGWQKRVFCCIRHPLFLLSLLAVACLYFLNMVTGFPRGGVLQNRILGIAWFIFVACLIYRLVDAALVKDAPSWRRLEIIVRYVVLLGAVFLLVEHFNPYLSQYLSVGLQELWVAAAGGALLGVSFRLTLTPAVRREGADFLRLFTQAPLLGKYRLPQLLLGLVMAYALAKLCIQLAPFWNFPPAFTDEYYYENYSHLMALGYGQYTLFYMPLYILFTGFLYYILGHFYLVFQITNIVLAIGTIFFIYMAIKTWLKSEYIALIAAFLWATTESSSYYAYTSQIENFNNFMVAVNYYLFVRCYVKGSLGSCLSWAFFSGLCLLTRNQNIALLLGQGALIGLGAVVGFFRQPARARAGLALTVLLCLVVGAAPLVSYGTYNLLRERVGRFVFSASSMTWQLALANHPYIKDGLGMADDRSRAVEAFEKKYPTVEAQRQNIWKETIHYWLEDPLRTLHWFRMRITANLGLLHPKWYKNQPLEWDKDWTFYLEKRFQIVFSLIALVGLLVFAHNRFALSMSLVFGLYFLPFIPFANMEERIRWPLDQMLLTVAAGLLYALATRRAPNIGPPAFFGHDTVACLSRARERLLSGRLLPEAPRQRRRLGMCLASLVVLGLVLAGLRGFVGKPNAFRSLRTVGAHLVDKASMDEAASSATPWEDLRQFKDPAQLVGKTVDVEGEIENINLPAQYHKTYMPKAVRAEVCYKFTAKPRPGYGPNPQMPWQLYNLSVCLNGADVEKSIHERDRVRIIGDVVVLGTDPSFEFLYIRARKVGRVGGFEVAPSYWP